MSAASPVAEVLARRTAPAAPELVETLPDEPTRVHCAGSYADRIVMTDAGLRFAAKSAIYDSPLVLTSIIVPL